MKVFIFAIIFFAFWFAAFIYLKNRSDGISKAFSEYTKWMKDSLDNMFYELSEAKVARYIWICAIVLGLIGFMLPGKFSAIDKIATIKKAMKFNNRGQYEEAILTLEDLKKTDAPVVHNELGVAYLGINDFESSEKSFKKAIRLLPNYSKPHLNLAVLYSHIDRETDAEFEHKRAKETSNYSISQDDLYGSSSGILDTLFIRLIVAGILAYAGYKIPWAVVKLMKIRRLNRFNEQFADGLVMVSNGLRAGLSLLQALDIASKESPIPLNQELQLILREHSLGSGLGEALAGMSGRMSTVDVKIFVNSILILQETGGNLTEIFDTIADTIQERNRVQKKIKTMTAEGEAQVVILSLLPLLLALMLNKMTPEVFELMYTTFWGWMMIILIILMEGIGLYWMFKIVKVKV